MKIEFRIKCKCGNSFTIIKAVVPVTVRIVAKCPDCYCVCRRKFRKGDVAFLKQVKERAA